MKITLPDNALQMVNQAVMNQKEFLKGFGMVETINKHRVLGKQEFAYDYKAYDVTPFGGEDEDGVNLFIPVTKPATYLSYSDEGRSDILTWYYSKKNKRVRDGIRLIWGPVRWIYAKEMDMTPQEVMENIEEEIWAGETPISGCGLPGWV